MTWDSHVIDILIIFLIFSPFSSSFPYLLSPPWPAHPHQHTPKAVMDAPGPQSLRHPSPRTGRGLSAPPEGRVRPDSDLWWADSDKQRPCLCDTSLARGAWVCVPVGAPRHARVPHRGGTGRLRQRRGRRQHGGLQLHCARAAGWWRTSSRGWRQAAGVQLQGSWRETTCSGEVGRIPASSATKGTGASWNFPPANSQRVLWGTRKSSHETPDKSSGRFVLSTGPVYGIWNGPFFHANP